MQTYEVTTSIPAQESRVLGYRLCSCIVNNPAYPLENFKTIYQALIKNYQQQTLMFIFMAVVLTLLQAPLPYLSGFIIDSVLPRGEFKPLLVSAGMMACLYLAFLVVDYLNDRYRLRIRQALMRDLNEQAISGILAMPRGQRMLLHSGDLTSRLTRDISELDLIMPYGLAQLAQKLLLSLAVLAVVFFMNWRLSSILLMLIPAAVLIYLRYDAALWKTSSEESGASAEKLSAVQELVEADIDIRAYDAQSYFKTHVGIRIADYERKRVAREMLDVKIGVVAIGMPMLAMVLIWLLGGSMVMAGEITIGFIVTYTATLTMLVPAIIHIIEFVSGAPNEITALNRIRDISQQPDTLTTKQHDVSEPYTCRQLCCIDLNFGYSSQSMLFRNLSLEFEVGNIYLVQGANGAGKSTLLQLIAGIMQPADGRVLVDDHETTELAEFSRWIGYLPQRPRLLSDSIKQNITLGEQLSDESLNAVLQQVGLTEWLAMLDAGVDQELINANQTLSGGQIQKIALARALVRNTPVLLLDEPTNNLDSDAVKNVLSLLDAQRQNRVTLVVSHDERVEQIVNTVIYLETTDSDNGTRVDVRCQE